jgi:hypothetical protein
MKNLNKPSLFNVCISIFLLFSFIGTTKSIMPTQPPTNTPSPTPDDYLCLPQTLDILSGILFREFKREV